MNLDVYDYRCIRVDKIAVIPDWPSTWKFIYVIPHGVQTNPAIVNRTKKEYFKSHMVNLYGTVQHSAVHPSSDRL